MYKSPGGGAYRVESGTSLASPVVAGAAALVLSKYPKLTPLEVKFCIMSASDTNDKLQNVLNIKGALLMAADIAKSNSQG